MDSARDNRKSDALKTRATGTPRDTGREEGRKKERGGEVLTPNGRAFCSGTIKKIQDSSWGGKEGGWMER